MIDLFSSNKVKIGIYIAKPLGWSLTYDYNNLPFGLKIIISELDQNIYSYQKSTIDNVNEFDFIFFSVNSSKDYLILIRDFYQKKIKPKIIIGGQDVVNLFLLRDIVHIQVLGRAEGQINDILKGVNFQNVWRRDIDYDIKNIYQIRQPQYLLKLGDRFESNVGCAQKCKFCQYGNKFEIFKKSKNYISGINENEVMFRDIDWNYATPKHSKLVSSLDGSDENTRKKVGKTLLNNEIIKKFEEINFCNFNFPVLLQLYNIIGFPWENEQTINFSELIYCFKIADSIVKNSKILIDIKFNHFIPMLLTPYECEPLNKINYREIIFKKYGSKIYNGKSIDVSIWNGFTSWLSAADRLYVYRSNVIDKHIIDMTKNRYYRNQVNRNSNDERSDFYNNCDLINKKDRPIIDYICL